MKVTDVHLSKESLANFRGRFFLLVDRSGECWPWIGPPHSSGAGRYKWASEDGGNDRYVGAHRVAYFLATGELPAYLRNLCGNLLCCRASHWWRKPTGQWKPKPRKAVRGRSQQLSDEEVRHVRLLSSLGGDEDEIGRQYGLSKRQVADIAMGKVRTSAGGRLRSSRHLGIQHYHELHEQELRSLSMTPDEPVVDLTPTSVPARPFPHTSYGHAPRRRMRW